MCTICGSEGPSFPPLIFRNKKLTNFSEAQQKEPSAKQALKNHFIQRGLKVCISHNFLLRLFSL